MNWNIDDLSEIDYDRIKWISDFLGTPIENYDSYDIDTLLLTCREYYKICVIYNMEEGIEMYTDIGRYLLTLSEIMYYKKAVIKNGCL